MKRGDICIWQNCVGRLAYLNGTECTLLSDLIHYTTTDTLEQRTGYVTDTRTITERGEWDGLIGEPHELRLKRWPGEDQVLALFRAPQLEPA